MNSFNKIDRLFITILFILSFAIGGVLARGDQTFPMVKTINPAEEEIPASTNQVVLTFNRNMDRKSVEEAFEMEPSISGKFSWIGKKMAYSFNAPLTSGKTLELTLSGAKDSQGKALKADYKKTYQVLEQSLWFIDEENRLSQLHLETGEIEVVSPPSYKVTEFRVKGRGETVFFMSALNTDDLSKNDLFRLDTTSGEITKIVDGKKEFIFSLALAPNGEVLLVRKGQINEFDQSSLIDPGSLWVYEIPGGTWSKFWNSDIYGNEFYFSPDSRYLVGRLVSGDITIIPIVEENGEVVYLENYAGSYSLSPDGKKLVFVDFEDPFSPHDLLLRGSDGKTKKLISGMGQIQFPIFNRTGNKIYFSMSVFEDNFSQTGLLSFNPYHLYEYDLEAEKLNQLTSDESYFEGFFTLSSDDQSIAFERYPSSRGDVFFEAQLESPTSELWTYDLRNAEIKKLIEGGVKPHLN